MTKHYLYTSGYISKGNENMTSKRYLHSHVHCRTLSIVIMWPQYGNNLGVLSAHQQMKKMYMYAMEYHSAIIKKGILSFVTTWMDFEGIMLSEISWT